MTIDRRSLLAGALALPCAVRAARAGADAPLTLEARETPSGRLAYVGDGFNGVLRAPKGTLVSVRLVNRLDAPTSIHWRGVRGPNAMDGVAPLVQKPVGPGETFDYHFTPPDAGLFMFHAHAEPAFALQTARGLSGLLLVEDAAEPPADLDVIAALGERPDEPSCRQDDAGPRLEINGAPAPSAHTAPPGARVRIRLANVTTSRLLSLVVEGARPQVIAIDGQPCALFEPLRGAVPAGPGARFELAFDMPTQPGASVIVRAATDARAQAPEALIFTAEGAPVATRPPIAGAPLNPLLPATIALDKARRMDLAFDVTPPAGAADCPDGPGAMWRINGKPAGSAPLFSVRRGTPVSLGFVNRSAVHTVIRVHGHVMRQLHLFDDGWDPYWRDAVVVPAGRTVRVAFVADNPGRWRIGAGVLPHAAGGLAAVFEVT